MSNYQSFIFKDWSFDAPTKTLLLHYSYDNQLNFEERYVFDVELTDYSEAAFTRAVDTLFFVAGVSYYKAYLAPEIKVEFGAIDKTHADFLSRTYQKGLGEFFYKNNLDPRTAIEFPVNSETLPQLDAQGSGKLVGLGGGKDSLVSLELLAVDPDIATWTLNHRQLLEPLVAATQVPHVWVSRAWDPQLEQLNKAGAMNGHVPISAIFACAGTVAAILSGKRDGVVSNESSADEPTLVYEGVEINHQYSKSSVFERDYQSILQADFGDSQRYYSLLRPLSELAIAEQFSKGVFDKYEHVFSSCNRAYVRTSTHLSWCGKCAKCAFVFLMLTPFIERQRLEQLFGKNLLLDEELRPLYKQLLGIDGDKPLDCVGEIEESRAAMELAKQQYPELSDLNYEMSGDYDYRRFGKHSIPEDVLGTLAAIR